MRETLLLVCFSPSLGGLEIHVRDFARWLARQPSVNLSLALRDGAPLHQALSSLNVPIWLAPQAPSHFPLVTVGKLVAFARAQGATRLYVHDQRDLLLGSLLQRRLRLPLAYMRHMALVSPKKDVYHRWLLSAVSRYLVVSDWMADAARRFLPLPAERIQRVWLGVPPAGAAPPVSRREAFSVGMLARILHDKGQHLLVEAAAQLKAESRELRVVLAGQVQQPEYWEAVQARAREAGVRLDYLGVLPSPTQGLAQLDVAVSASQAECFGLSTVEAMRHGLPVVGADSGATPEIIRDGESGLIFKSGDAQDLAAQLRRVMDDLALRQRLAAAAKQRADQEFDADTQFARIWEVVSAMR